MSDRSRRVNTATLTSASESAGMNAERRFSTGSSVRLVHPVAGNQPSCSANR
jgi:hypothetical protein